MKETVKAPAFDTCMIILQYYLNVYTELVLETSGGSNPLFFHASSPLLCTSVFAVSCFVCGHWSVYTVFLVEYCTRNMRLYCKTQYYATILPFFSLSTHLMNYAEQSNVSSKLSNILLQLATSTTASMLTYRPTLTCRFIIIGK